MPHQRDPHRERHAADMRVVAQSDSLDQFLQRACGLSRTCARQFMLSKSSFPLALAKSQQREIMLHLARGVATGTSKVSMPIVNH